MSDSCASTYTSNSRVFNVSTPRGRADMASFIAKNTTCASKPTVIQDLEFKKGPRGKTTVTKVMCIIVK